MIDYNAYMHLPRQHTVQDWFLLFDYETAYRRAIKDVIRGLFLGDIRCLTGLIELCSSSLNSVDPSDNPVLALPTRLFSEFFTVAKCCRSWEETNLLYV